MQFNSRYLGHPPWDSGISPPELKTFMRQTKAGRALDLGCGTGTNLLTLAQAGWQAEGVEYALIAYRKARRRLRPFGNNARVYLGSVVEIDYLSRPYDLILDIGCYHSLSAPEKEKYRENVLRLLAPGGSILIYGFLMTTGSQTGIEEAEIDRFAQELKIVERQDGFDHGRRPSVWMSFRRDR